MRKSTWLLIGALVGSVAEHNLNKIPQYARWTGVTHEPTTIPFPDDEKKTLETLLHAHKVQRTTLDADKSAVEEIIFTNAARELRGHDVCIDPIDRHDAATMFVRCSDPLTTYRARVTFSPDGSKTILDYY